MTDKKIGDRTVVLTGASTGIGKATALKEVKAFPGKAPIEVARIVATALKGKRPKAQYLIGPGARKMKNLARLPGGLRDRMMYQAIYGKHSS